MGIINIAICDDNEEYVSTFEKQLYEISNVKIEYDVYHSGESLVRAYENGIEKYDVVFLDMEMKKLNGIETASLIKELDEHVIIVFVTSYTKYMRDTFKCSPFDFLVKPVDDEELKMLFCGIQKRLSKRRMVLAFSENKTKVRLYCDDIIYCESQNHWLKIYTRDNEYKLCKPISELSKQLDKSSFCRVHKSYLINFQYIKSIKENDAILYHCDKLIPISRTYKKDVLKEYTEFLERDFRV